MSSSNNDTSASTLKSYVDSAVGAAQNALGSLTGSSGDQTQGEAKQDKAQAEYDASHATLKGPGFTATASGVKKDDPDRSAGSWNQTIGSAKESLGGLIGNEVRHPPLFPQMPAVTRRQVANKTVVQSLKQAGREQNLQGQQQEAKGQLNDWGSGVADRVTGAVGGAVSGLTGNQGAQDEYQKQHDSGKTQQRGAEHDIQKQAEAQK